MSRIPPCRKIALLLLACVLSAPWALEAAPPAGRSQPAHFFDQSGPALLRQLWGLLSALWNETGCHVNPDGCTQNARPAAPADEGCHIDPSGCARAGSAPPAADQADEGCHIDPDGCVR